MAGLVKIKDIEEYVINICPKGTAGEVIDIDDLKIQLPAVPDKSFILFNKLPKEQQHWRRIDPPTELSKIRSMDEWHDMPKQFKERYTDFIGNEFQRRREGVWFMNNGVPTYITGHHYMFLQWSKIDIGYPSYLEFQNRLSRHFVACENDPRSMGQVYVKCRRSGYTQMCSGILADEGTQVKDKLLGIVSKTGKDAQENVFMKKIMPIYRNYPFFFKPIQDGTTNPRSELAFREPSKRITKNNKTTNTGEALNTIVNWKNTTSNAYDGEKLHLLFLDEAGKIERPEDITEIWRIHRTCLLVGRKIIGKSMVGSTVNPLDKGGANFKKMVYNSDPSDRNDNGRTKSGLYKIFVPAYEALEGFFDLYGNPVIDDPKEPVLGVDQEMIEIGAKTFLKNERKALSNDSYDLNEVIRQFPFTMEEAFRDSTKASTFNIAKIYEQLEHNMEIYPSPVVQGNFVWKDGVQDSEVIFRPDANGRFRISWMPPIDIQNKQEQKNGKKHPGNAWLGVGGVDSYDLDSTVDGRGSKGALHLYNKVNMEHPSNMFVLEYASRPPLARIFYEDVLMAAVFYGYLILIENNKYGIARYFENRGYDSYLMNRPDHLNTSRSATKTKGIPSNSQDVIQAHAQSIEAYIHEHVGTNEEGHARKMYFDKTLEEWINFKIDDRTKYDLTISSGLALLAAQKSINKEKKKVVDNRKFFRKATPIQR
tara:strand:+ start:5717 stop:7834 length:2118 start_codon:yes stop_codon:yes gene_type:complete